MNRRAKPDQIDRAAKVIAPIIANATACGYDPKGTCGTCRADSALIVKALDDAGLLNQTEGENRPMDRYPTETLDPDDDDGTMPASVEALRQAVVGHRITSAERKTVRTTHPEYRWTDTHRDALVLTLDDGRSVIVANEADCCAYTELEAFLTHPERVNHVITGVGTTDGYTRWHIYADMGDVLEMTVGWSCGNPFYYAYGFNILVSDEPTEGENDEPA